MEPRIQYAQTKDGVSIAFWTAGTGTPLVVMPSFPFSHVELEWQIPEYRRYYERIIENGNVIRYDNRGSGLSDRDVTDHSLDAHVSDLEAVVDRLGLHRVALVAPLNMGSTAIAFSVRNSERVSHLILWCSFARMSDYSSSPVTQALAAMRDKDFVLYTETVSHAALGWAEGEPARQYASLMRECVTQDACRAMFEAMSDFDVSGLLKEVKSPTLVLHRREVNFPPVELSKGLASKIPGARLTLLEGTSLAPFLGDMAAVVDSIDDFIREGEEPGAAPEPSVEGAVHTILFTDVEGSTALTQRLGDAKARELLREHERIVREALKAHGGAEVKTMGDGFMASFSSATRALECAIAMQRAFAERNESAEEPIRVRVGLNAGEPIVEEKDLFGTAVNLSARICAHAEAGQILAPIVVRELAAGKQFMFADLGETELRGFEDPVRLYEVRWREKE
jgi:class 3 adenylate cyclase